MITLPLPHEYKYVGSPEHLPLIGKSTTRRLIKNSADVLQWIEETNQFLNHQGEVIATFIVNTSGELWIADRRSEHIVCSDGEDVYAAGELTFQKTKSEIEVVAATNQSTGYCPKPNSWTMLAATLNLASIARPSGFTTNFIFRRCDNCTMTNIVKDDYFFCAVCESPLAKSWNFETKTSENSYF